MTDLTREEIAYYYRLPPTELADKYLEDMKVNYINIQDTSSCVQITDENNRNFTSAEKLQKLLLSIKNKTTPFKVVLVPSQIIYWFKGSLTDLIQTIEVFNLCPQQKRYYPYGMLTDTLLFDYLHHLKAEDMMITNYRRKENGEAIGRPKKFLPSVYLAELVIAGKNLRQIAQMYNTCGATIQGRIHEAKREGKTIHGEKAMKVVDAAILELDRRHKILKKKFKKTE